MLLQGVIAFRNNCVPLNIQFVEKQSKCVKNKQNRKIDFRVIKDNNKHISHGWNSDHILLKLYIGMVLERFNFRAQTAAEFTCTDLHANEIICKWCLEHFIHILWPTSCLFRIKLSLHILSRKWKYRRLNAHYYNFIHWSHQFSNIA